MTNKPSHIVLFSSDRYTICGLKAKDAPHCLLRFAHEHKYDHSRCATCYTHAGLEAMLGPNDDPPLPLFVASPEVELRPSRAARDRKRSSVRAVLPTHITRPKD